MERKNYAAYLYGEDHRLKPEELRRLTPGTAEFEILDGTMRACRLAFPSDLSYEHFNVAYRVNPFWQLGEKQNHNLPAFDERALTSLRHILTCSPSNQRLALDNDEALEDLLLHYLDKRQATLDNPAPLPVEPCFPLVTKYSADDELYNSLARLYAAHGYGSRPEDLSVPRYDEWFLTSYVGFWVTEGVRRRGDLGAR